MFLRGFRDREGSTSWGCAELVSVGLVFEMDQKGGWDQYSGCPGRGLLGSVDLGAGESLGGGGKLVDTLRGAVR